MSILSKNYTRLIVFNIATGEEIAVITDSDQPITTESENIVVRLTPKYD